MIRRSVIVISAVATLLAACGDDTPTTTALPEGAAPISLDLVQLRQVGADPTTVVVDISGTKPSPCHTIETEITRSGHTVIVQLWAAVPDGEVCTQVISRFDATIDLGTYPPGSYHIDFAGRPYEMHV